MSVKVEQGASLSPHSCPNSQQIHRASNHHSSEDFHGPVVVPPAIYAIMGLRSPKQQNSPTSQRWTRMQNSIPALFNGMEKGRRIRYCKKRAVEVCISIPFQRMTAAQRFKRWLWRRSHGILNRLTRILQRMAQLLCSSKLTQNQYLP